MASRLLNIESKKFEKTHKQIFTIGVILFAFGAATLASGASVWELPFARRTILDASKFFVVAGMLCWVFVFTILLVEGLLAVLDKSLETSGKIIYTGLSAIAFYFIVGYSSIAFSYILHLNRCTWVHKEDGFCAKKYTEMTSEDLRELDQEPKIPCLFSNLRNLFD